MNLKERTRHFLKEFPEAKMNYTLLAKVYRQYNITKKRIKWEKVKNDKTKTEAEAIKEKSKMIRELTKAKKDGYRIVYIDETMFTRKTIPKKEYSLPSQNMTVD